MRNPIKSLISILAVAAIGLVIAFFLTNDSSTVVETSDSDSPSIASTVQTEPRPRSSKPEPEENSDSNQKKPTDNFDEDDFAIPVEGNPLAVTLLHYPELGQISIEAYKNGKFTGRPLKSGTKVQISDPNNKGEKIQFIVP